jgi:hypothetical protein
MFDAEVYNRVNGVEGACLTGVDTAKGAIVLGHSIAGVSQNIVLCILGIKGAFTFTQNRVRIVKSTTACQWDSLRLGTIVANGRVK